MAARRRLFVRGTASSVDERRCVVARGVNQDAWNAVATAARATAWRIIICSPNGCTCCNSLFAIETVR